jgi:hypothetical protein
MISLVATHGLGLAEPYDAVQPSNATALPATG